MTQVCSTRNATVYVHRDWSEMTEETIKAIEARHLRLSVSTCDNVSLLAAALREANAKIDKLLQLRPNVGVKKEQ